MRPHSGPTHTSFEFLDLRGRKGEGMPVSAAIESLLAQLYPTGSTSLLLQDFTTAQQGMTVVCLSGGGSRALTAGMGQLNGLRTVNYDSCTSLLSMVTGLSTVSG